ncbi:unnamed protein product, partial [Closterium sp. NIES-53]
VTEKFRVAARNAIDAGSTAWRCMARTVTFWSSLSRSAFTTSLSFPILSHLHPPPSSNEPEGKFGPEVAHLIIPTLSTTHLHSSAYFLPRCQDSSNKREDEFGGSLENRIRFPLQVGQATMSFGGAMVKAAVLHASNHTTSAPCTWVKLLWL